MINHFAKEITFNSGTTMKYYGRHGCNISDLYINGIKTYDCCFGEGYDDSPATAPDYGCGNRKWRAYTFEYAKEIGTVDKLSITEDDFNKICDFLTEILSIGSCGYCA